MVPMFYVDVRKMVENMPNKVSYLPRWRTLDRPLPTVVGSPLAMLMMDIKAIEEKQDQSDTTQMDKIRRAYIIIVLTARLAEMGARIEGHPVFSTSCCRHDYPLQMPQVSQCTRIKQIDIAMMMIFDLIDGLGAVS